MSGFKFGEFVFLYLCESYVEQVLMEVEMWEVNCLLQEFVVEFCKVS